MVSTMSLHSVKRCMSNLFLLTHLISLSYSIETIKFQNIHDFDQDGTRESLLLNSGQYSISWVEIVDSKVDELLWSYNLPNGSSFLDAELADLNNDGYLEIIVIAKNPVFSINQNWLYVFKGREKLFENNPITSNYLSLDLGTTIRPLNISKIPDTQNQIAVAFGTPIRKAMIFNLLIGDSDLEIEKIKLLRAPIIENGYGHIFASGFKNNNKTFFAILSPENNKIKTAVFDMDSDAVLLKSDILLVGDATHLIGAGIQPNKGEDGISDGLIIPYGSDDMFLLEINGSELLFNKTDVAEGKTPQVVKFNNGKLEKKTINKTRLNGSNIQTGGMNLINKDDDSLIPPPLPEEKNEKLDFDKITSLPYDYKETQLKQKIVPENKKNDFDILTPTIGDYLSSIKTNAINKQDDIEKITIPDYNEEMNVDMIADEAGFEKVNVDLPFDEVKETENIDNLPSLDEEILTFSNSIKEKIAFRPMVDDSSLFNPVEGEIDLYYVMAITPSIKDSKDRYVFDGEAPFGVSVNQIPQLGQPSHFQHSISANLNGLRPGETFDFAYSLRKSNMDSITTLVMVHDLQTNVFFISVLPSHDSLSQSYQPESFDPTLFEFPNYFFEGFPTSLGMDFADRLIRFSFDGSTDSVVHRGIYLSSTTPSLPPQSLAVFMDEGKLQSIRGEVIVRQNGSKKITTEFDLSGGIKPSVMFSHLLKEEFPDSLKFQLLKDGSIKKPLFGPQGKLPKITKAERLPDAQSDQSDPEIPIVPIQSIVPKSEKFTPVLLSSDKDSNITKASPTKSDEESERIQTAADSLKLEKAKTVVVNKEIGNKEQKEPTPPVPEMSQPESLVPKPTFPDQNPNNDQPEIDIDPTISNENSKKNSAGSDENIISEDETRAKTDRGFKEPSGEEVVIPDNNNQNEPKDN